jgi:predicted dehydrogenase
VSISVNHSTVKVGFIGLGVGACHVDTVLAHPLGEVSLLCDTDNSKVAHVSSKIGHSVRVTSDPREVLRDPGINMVVIASYDQFHADQILLALDSEKHVFVEKPLCLLRSDAERIAEVLLKKPHLKLSSNLVLRTYKRFRYLKQQLLISTNGQLYLLEGDYLYGRLEKILQGWRGQTENYSVMLGGGIHIIDLMNWLTGDLVQEVIGYESAKATSEHSLPFCDCSISLLSYRTGILGKVCANFACIHPHFHSLRLFHTEYTYENRLDALYKQTSRAEGTFPEPVLTDTSADKSLILSSFLDELTGRGSAVVSVQDVFNTMAVCFSILDSIAERRSTTVDYWNFR